MEKKKATSKGSPKQSDSHYSAIPGPRHLRIMTRLQSGPCSREELDRVSGASNSPHYVLELRRLNWDLPCRLVPHVDRDGVRGSHGEYSLSADDRGRLHEWAVHRLNTLHRQDEGGCWHESA